MQSLSADDAVVSFARQTVRVREVPHDCGAGIAGDDVEDFTGDHAIAPEAPRIAVVPDLQHAAANIRGMSREERFNVVPVDWQAAVEPELTTDGLDLPQIAEVYGATRGK
jgi:hypothetical protein